MSDKYRIADKEKAYFITFTVVNWIDVFTRKKHKLTIVDSLKYCQREKGLELYGWCLMSSHLHLIAKAAGENTLSEIIRDFKKFTAKALIKQIEEEAESRREWMLKQFEFAGKYLSRIEKYKFWQDSNHAEEIVTPDFFWQKLDYLHNNPVEEMIITKPEEYMFSSASNYAELYYLIEIVLETQRLITYK